MKYLYHKDVVSAELMVSDVAEKIKGTLYMNKGTLGYMITYADGRTRWLTTANFNNNAKPLRGLTFGEMVKYLEDGYVAARPVYAFCIVKQIPQTIKEKTIPLMSSLPSTIKDELLSEAKCINYDDQVLQINTETGDATSYTPIWKDVFSKDWMIV